MLGGGFLNGVERGAVGIVRILAWAFARRTGRLGRRLLRGHNRDSEVGVPKVLGFGPPTSHTEAIVRASYVPRLRRLPEFRFGHSPQERGRLQRVSEHWKRQTPMTRLPMRLSLILCVGVLLGASACSDTAMAPAVPDPVPACEQNNTATVEFRNTSNSNTTYDVIWDGSKITSVGPNQTSQKYTVAAGVQHTMVFKVTNTSNNACSLSTPTFAQCAEHWLSCSF